MGARNKKRKDELHRKVNAKALQFAASLPQGPSSAPQEAAEWIESRKWIIRVVEGVLYGSGISAEDVAQEVQRKAWQNRETFRGDSEYNTWLYKIAVNTAVDFLRKVRKNVVSLDDVRVDGEEKWRVPEPEAPSVDIDKIISVKETLSKLSRMNAKIITLRLQGESPEAIARQLGMRNDAVRKRISRSLRQLIKLARKEDRGRVERPNRKPIRLSGEARGATESQQE